MMTRQWLGVAEKVDKTARHYGRRLVHGCRDLWWPWVDRRALCRPVLVVGCSRSGTTVTYKTLSLAPDIATLDREAHAFWESLHPAAERDALAAHAACEHAR